MKTNQLMSMIALLLAVSMSASADLYTFDAITSYTNNGYQSVVSQLSVTVETLTDTSASLVFDNEGPVASSVTALYFDYGPEDGVGLDVPAVPAGWVFDTPPPYLPGGEGIFSADFSLMANPPPTKNGISAGSSLEVILSYNTGFDILAALNSGDLRLGLHTVGIIDTEGRLVTQDDIDAAFPEDIGEVGDAWSYSESSINNIPEAASSSLILLCSVGSLFIRRFFRS